MRGGVVGFLFVLVIFVIGFVHPSKNGFFLWNVVAYPFAIIEKFKLPIDPWIGGGIGFFLIPPISYFLAGSFLGLLYGKIKNRRKVSIT